MVVTRTAIWQLLAGGMMVPIGSVTVLPPAVAAATPAGQVSFTDTGVVFTMPAGYWSTKTAVSVAEMFCGLVMVMVSVALCPANSDVGVNTLLMLGAATNKGAVAVPKLLPTTVCTAPTAMMLV